MNPFVKVYNFIQREFAYSTQIENQGKFIPFFDRDNRFPIELDELIQRSPTATACLSTLADFIAGEGFNVGPQLENLVINKQGTKFYQFHTICSDTISRKWGVASLVRYNKTGGITEFESIPFNYVRLKAPDDNGLISKVLYNPYFGTHLYRHQDNIEFDVFNPAQAVVQAGKDKKWKGQIYWAGIRDGKHPFYPVPDFYAAKEWMRVERNAGIYFDENLEHGFLNDYIFKLIGDPNEPSGEEKDGKPVTKGEVFDREMSKNFSGSKNRAKAMAMWGNNKEEWPDIQAFPTAGNPDLYRVQDEHATKKITIATKVPAILANISEGVSLGGDGNTIRASVKLMQQRVIRMQSFLLDYYTNILSHFVFPEGQTAPTTLRITPYHPFPELETVDPQAWAVLSREEQRKWVKDHTEIEIQEEQPAQTPTPTTEPAVENKYLNLHFNSYPKSARDTAKKAIDFHDKMDLKCLKPNGRKQSEAIINGAPLGPKEIRRLSNYLSKNVLYNNRTYSDSCEKIEFDAWGGVDMMIWANEKVKELRGDE